jgi:hypothetical protein
VTLLLRRSLVVLEYLIDYPEEGSELGSGPLTRTLLIARGLDILEHLLQRVMTSVGCRCNADPPTPHGPYWHWTAKVNGKTVTRRLSAHEAQLHQEWVGNDRRIRSLLAQIRTVDAKTAELILRENVSG